MQNIDNYNPFIVRDAFNSGTTVLLAGGTGQGYMSTDTTAILRAKELQCDAWIKITKYDHIYDRDPSLDTSAKELHNVTYHQILQEQLGIMDLSAAAIGVSNGPPLIIANGNNIDELWEKIDEKEVVT